MSNGQVQNSLIALTHLTWAFLNLQSWGRGGEGRGHDDSHNNFLVYATILIKFGRDMELDVFYTISIQKFVMSLRLRNYDVITRVFAYA